MLIRFILGIRHLATGFLLLVSGLNFTEQFGRLRPCGLGPKEAYVGNGSIVAGHWLLASSQKREASDQNADT